MFKHILIATDGSELADKAVVQGLTLARALNAKATAITVTEPWDARSMAAIAEAQMRNPIADYEARTAAAANRILSSVREKAKKLSSTSRPRVGAFIRGFDRTASLVLRVDQLTAVRPPPPRPAHIWRRPRVSMLVACGAPHRSLRRQPRSGWRRPRSAIRSRSMQPLGRPASAASTSLGAGHPT